MDSFKILIGLAGGLGLFIYGMQMCSEGLQKMAAHRLKQWVKTLTSNPVLGLLIGVLVTLGLQSSSATSALVVGFISSGMMTLSQALGVLLGSAIGASLTLQLIAFQTTYFALFLLFLGASLYLFAKRSRQRNLGQAILGFGLIFYGMFVMATAMAPVKDYPLVVQTLIRLEQFPLLEFLSALLITAIIQSSPAFLGLCMVLATHHLIGPLSIIPFVLGAHLGGTVTGVLSSIGAPGRDAKRAAAANFLFKLLNGLLFLPFYRPLTHLMMGHSPDLSRAIANMHTFFSLAMAAGFLPFTSLVSGLTKRFIPDRRIGLEVATYLDDSMLEIPELAVDQAQRQTLEMGRIIEKEMINRIVPAVNRVHDDIDDIIDPIAEVEQAVDSLYKQISKYVTSLGENKLDDELMQRSIQILSVAKDLEYIGDIIIGITSNIQKIQTEGLELSQEGLAEIEEMFEKAHHSYNMALKSFETMDQALATNVIKEHPKILRLEKALRYSHFDRMQGGNQKTVATSSIHMDIIEALYRIDLHAVDIAQVVVGIV